MLVLTLTTLLAGAPASAAPKIEVHGHRGARAVRPENTLPAFRYALEAGVDVLELDLVVTADDRLVVHHDPYVGALCRDPKGRPPPEHLPLRTLTLEALRRYDCGAVRNPRFPNQKTVPGTRIPTFDEVLALAAAHRRPVGLNVEMKYVPDRGDLFPPVDRYARLVVDALKRHAMLRRSVVQSFDHATLLAVKARAPKARLSMLISDNRPPLVPVAKAIGAEVISPYHLWITKADVDALHRAGVRVIPWTANDPKAWTRLLGLGVDGIITDDPAALIAFLKARAP